MRSRTKRKRAICQDCNKKCYVEKHHEPPKSEGGTEKIPLCHKCHVGRHCAANHWAMWGQRGGRKTAQTPANWRRNLKQFRPYFRAWEQHNQQNGVSNATV
jgi:hypothetical protein